MAKKEKKWFGVTRSPEEDLALVDMMMSSQALTVRRTVVVVVMSVVIMGVYIAMNVSFFPAYPVVTSHAEENDAFVEHYPPFRMNEWVNYSVTRKIIDGGFHRNDVLSRGHPLGYPLLAVPLTLRWGERGMFFTNAFILWISALVFLFLMLEIVEFPLAVASTLVLALATLNIFYAASAFSEPAAQLFTVLAVFLFVKGLMSTKEWVYYSLCGFSLGLNVFVKPSLALAVVFFLVLLVNDRGRFSIRDRNIIGLGAGFLIPLAVFFAVGGILLGGFRGEGFPADCGCGFVLDCFPGTGRNLITGLWRLLFDGPHGLAFVMPLATLVPMGVIVMWRNEIHSVTMIVGILLLYCLLTAAAGSCPVPPDGVGSRHLVPVIPLMVIPLAFLWREQTGEKIWLVTALIFTVYMSGFGWWTGKVRGGGLLVGALQDRAARYIILARKDMLERDRFGSAGEFADGYVRSLDECDVKLWLQTLDREVLREIEGFERTVFHELCREVKSGRRTRGSLVESVDPNRGVRPVLPSLSGIPGPERR